MKKMAIVAALLTAASFHPCAAAASRAVSVDSDIVIYGSTPAALSDVSGTSAKYIADAIDHAAILVLCLDIPRYYVSDRLIPPPCIHSFRMAILRFGTPHSASMHPSVPHGNITFRNGRFWQKGYFDTPRTTNKKSQTTNHKPQTANHEP